jgi:hypothetical protein
VQLHFSAVPVDAKKRYRIYTGRFHLPKKLGLDSESAMLCDHQYSRHCMALLQILRDAYSLWLFVRTR